VRRKSAGRQFIRDKCCMYSPIKKLDLIILLVKIDSLRLTLILPDKNLYLHKIQ